MPIADWHGRRYYSVENNRQRNHLEHRQKSVNDHFRIIVYQSVTLTAVLLRLRRSIIAWLLLQYMAPKLTHVDPLTVAYRR